MERINQSEDRSRCRAVLHTVLNILVQKMYEIFSLAESVKASQKGLCCMEVISYLVIQSVSQSVGAVFVAFLRTDF